MGSLPRGGRGRRFDRQERQVILSLLDEAQAAGARLKPACEVLGIDARTIQRWREVGGGEDGRHGPKGRPGNQLSKAEQKRVLAVANSQEFRNLSPKQIVPKLADRGRYLASESTFYRLLRAAGQMTHRGSAKPPRHVHRPTPYIATGPNQVWSWDITYLRSPVTGQFYYLYLFMDVWSRKIVGWAVHEVECGERASDLLKRTLRAEGLQTVKLVLHADNGSPMKESTLVATMQHLGVIPSYSRPRVSNDNPFSESLFGTMKGRPQYPRRPFKNLQAATEWTERFVHWYHEEHLHSEIGFVTPFQRHNGQSETILARRRAVYAAAKARQPNRWSGKTRAWVAPDIVHLNPAPVDPIDKLLSQVA